MLQGNNIFIPVVIFIVVLGSAFFFRSSTALESQKTASTNSIPTENSAPTPLSLPSTAPAVLGATAAPSSPTPTPLSITSLQYPDSKQTSTTASPLILESTANADTITTWYKDKIVSLGMNVKNFVSTTTNNNVLNKLSGVSSDTQIQIEISKKSNENTVKITITLN